MYLDRNRLSFLPPGLLAHFPYLTMLRLNGNRLTALPPGLFARLPYLETLDLSGNPLTCLPPAPFSRLSRLRTLSLADSDLGNAAPLWFQGLPYLERLTFGPFPAADALRDRYRETLPQLFELHVAGDGATAYRPCPPAPGPRAAELAPVAPRVDWSYG